MIIVAIIASVLLIGVAVAVGVLVATNTGENSATSALAGKNNQLMINIKF